MNDIRLWEHLVKGPQHCHEHVDVDELVKLLDQLAGVAVEDRVPLLGVLPHALSHPKSTVRRAALGALAGVSGFRSFQWLAAGLDDPDENTAKIALEALAESAKVDPSRWIHGLFHPNSGLRQRAVELSGSLETDWYRLFLLTDEHTASSVRDNLPRQLPIDSVPAVLDLVDADELSLQEAHRLLAPLPVAMLCDYLVDLDPRPRQEWWALVKQYADEAGEPPGEYITPFERALSLFWHPSPTSQQFFADLARWSLHEEPHNPALAASLLATARRQGHWNPHAAGVCCLVFPNLLALAWVPRSTRRESLIAVYTAGQKTLIQPKPTVIDLLDCELCRDERSGLPDLWVVGGILHFLHGRRYPTAVEHFGIQELVAGFLADPQSAASFFCHPDDSKPGRQELIKSIAKRAPEQRSHWYALLATVVRSDRLEFLHGIGYDVAAQVAEKLIELDGRSEFRIKDNKSQRLVQALGSQIIPHGTRHFVQAIAWANGVTTSAFGLELFGFIVRETPAERFWTLIKRFDVHTLKRLLSIIDACPGFPYGTEKLLSVKLHKNLHPDIQAWLKSGARGAADPSLVSTPVAAGAKKVPRTTQHRISTCSDAQLSSKICDWVSFPSLRLCSALSARSPPHEPMVTVCLTLLGCHDPTEQVTTQFERFDGKDESFRRNLDVDAVRHWQGQKDLPLVGNAWLHLWEAHCFKTLEQLEASVGGLSGALEATLKLPSRVLITQIFNALTRIVAILRYRDKPRLGEMASDGLLDLLVELLIDDLVGVQAAKVIASVYVAGVAEEELAKRRPGVIALLPDLSMNVRDQISIWIRSTGLATARISVNTLTRHEREQLIDQVRHTKDPQKLEAYCESQDPRVVEEAALLLIELGEGGIDRLTGLLCHRMRDPKRVPQLRSLVGTLALWPMTSALGQLYPRFTAGEGDAELRFLLARSWLELEHTAVERLQLLDTIVLAGCEDTVPHWFQRGDWNHFKKLEVDELWLAQHLAVSPHPNAYIEAVEILTARGGEVAAPGTKAALVSFLRCGTNRLKHQRVKAAQWLHEHGDDTGFPVLIQEALFGNRGKFTLGKSPLKDGAEVAIGATVGAAAAVGPEILEERKILDHIMRIADPLIRERMQLQLLQDATRGATQQILVTKLKRSPGHADRVHRLAQSFAWGIRRGLELTGRLYRIVMIGGEGLGYTRLNENRIYITPMPILRREAHGEDVVRGLILHEFGHHLYHRGEEEEAIWNRASEQKLHQLLNLVADEHLERNLRAMDADYGDRLKRLGAYAFQHSDKRVDISGLLTQLRQHAFRVLSSVPLGVAKTKGCVIVENGKLLIELERSGSSFARFMRALRMGLGNRYRDPKVAKGLALFTSEFRDSSMGALYDITIKLRDIFGSEVDMLSTLDEHHILEPDGDGLMVFGEGLSDHELEREIDRILGRESTKSPRSGGSASRAINISPSEDFSPITQIEMLPFDPAQHVRYATQIASHARAMERFLADLGLIHRVVNQRTRGYRVDRGRLMNNILKADPRMMMARQMERQTDLFLGILVDCSGSMQHRDNIEKAKLFATLLAEAGKGMQGIDVRLFGFTESLIYDAGDANRCAAHALEAGGGNNDAAALLHGANVAMASKRKAKLLVMISDGLPTDCSTAALQGLVRRLTRQWGIVCAQVAVEPLEVVCFPHYVVIKDQEDVGLEVRRFGEVVARLVRATLHR